ncbi:MAG: hypothetical protein ACJ788_13645 [Ktedonobacteraceae bacterium]
MGGGLLQAARVSDAAGSPLGCRVCRLQPGKRGRGTSNTRPFKYLSASTLHRYSTEGVSGV